MDIHKTLSCFYTTKKIPHEGMRSICIYLKSFSSKAAGRLYEFATKVYFQSSVALLNWRINVVIIVNATQMSLKWT